MKRRGFTFVELMVLIAIIATLLAIAIPDFLKFGAKSAQSEAKTNLASITTASISYYAENNMWGGTFEVVGWSPTGNCRYKYTIETGGGTELGATGGEHGAHLCNNSKNGCVDNCRKGVGGAPAAGVHSKLGFTATAEGNIDSEYKHNDCWWINQNKRPNNSINDFNED